MTDRFRVIYTLVTIIRIFYGGRDVKGIIQSGIE